MVSADEKKRKKKVECFKIFVYLAQNFSITYVSLYVITVNVISLLYQPPGVNVGSF